MSEINKDDAQYKIIPLQFPIDMSDGTQLVTIKMSRRFKVGHLRMIPKDFLEYAAEENEKSKKKKGTKIDLTALIPLLAALCNLGEDTFDKMDFVDLVTVSKEIENFFPKELSQQTGSI
jgi:hypothetical protein